MAIAYHGSDFNEIEKVLDGGEFTIVYFDIYKLSVVTNDSIKKQLFEELKKKNSNLEMVEYTERGGVEFYVPGDRERLLSRFVYSPEEIDQLRTVLKILNGNEIGVKNFNVFIVKAEPIKSPLDLMRDYISINWSPSPHVTIPLINEYCEVFKHIRGVRTLKETIDKLYKDPSGKTVPFSVLTGGILTVIIHNSKTEEVFNRDIEGYCKRLINNS